MITIFGYVFLAIVWMIVIYMIVNALINSNVVKFVYRHTIRSNDWRPSSFIWAIKASYNLYVL